MKQFYLSLILIPILCSLTYATIINVPADQPTIQAGINAAVHGDTVLVEDSTYYENINFNGKAITVASHFLMDGDTNHISNTIIDGSQPSHPDSGSVVYFISGEDTNSVLCGFTITGGTGNRGVGMTAPNIAGGGICIDNSGAKIQYNIIDSNQAFINDQGAYSYGGGLDVYTSSGNVSLIVENNTIRNNRVESPMAAHGGGMDIWWFIDTPTRIINNIIQNNECISSQHDAVGGGICYESEEIAPRSTIIVGNIVRGNRAVGNNPANRGGFGGGIEIYYTEAQVLDNAIVNNCVGSLSGQYSYGAGLKIDGGPSCEVRNNVIKNNYYDGGNCSGGGLHLWNNSTKLLNNIICMNQATAGGGLSLYTSSDKCIVNGEYTVKEYSGKPINVRRSKKDSRRVQTPQSSNKCYNQTQDRIELINNTITENQAISHGAGIYTMQSNVLVMNSILWGDRAGAGFHEIYCPSGSTWVYYSDIEGAWPGINNINADPLFIDPLNDNYHLSNNSPCLGAGIDAMQIGGSWYYAPPEDFEGDPRPMPAYTMPDMGADENPLGPSNILYVPQQYPSIQAGINEAVDGDTVLVADSTYYENINFKGKAITVASYFLMDGDTNHISNTIIDGSQPANPDSGSVVTFSSGEDTTSILYGFTISGGTGTINQSWNDREGGGIYLAMSGGRVAHNKIIHNTCTYTAVYGAGITADADGNHIIIIEDNVIHSNTGTAQGAAWCCGGGIACNNPNGKVYIRHNKIYHNHLHTQVNSNVRGAGINFSWETHISIEAGSIVGNQIYGNECHPAFSNAYNTGAGISIGNVDVDIRNNIISNNVYHSYGYGGGLYLYRSDSRICNNIISQNSAPFGGGIYVEGTPGDDEGYSGLTNPAQTEAKKHKSRTRSAGGRLEGISSVNTETSMNTYDTEPLIINNTITENLGESIGGGLYAFHSNPYIMNTIFWGDSAVADANEIYVTPGDTLNIVYSDFDPLQVTGNWSGTGNIDVDPCLHDSLMAPNDTLFCCLAYNSSCIDAGHPDTSYNDIRDPLNPGYALWPAMGTLRNDMGTYGGHGKAVIPVGIKGTPYNQVLHTYELRQNYPNPFNPVTTITFDLPKTSKVTLKIYNILGEEVATLLSASLLSGSYKYVWDATGLASGMYLYHLEAGDFTQTKKLILLK